MRRFTVMTFVVILLSSALVFAQTPSPTTSSTAHQIAGFDANALDRGVDPCNDFYTYACGGWMAKNPIPADQPSWGRFNELAENNRLILKAILEKAAVNDPNRSAVDQKIGDYYDSCMDEKAIEQKGLAPLKLEMDRINGLKNKSELPAYLAAAHQKGSGAFFYFSSEPDAKNASMMIAGTDQGGLGLPDRDYYLNTDAKSIELRKQYVQHMVNMFQLLADPAKKAEANANAVMAIETALAKASLDKVSRRDPQKTYHKLTTKELAALSPNFDWSRYFAGTPAPKFDSLDVAVPDYVKGMNAVIASTSLDDLKTYLTWNIVRLATPFLPDKFVEENFNFYGKTLTGAKQLRPRWKRCVQHTDGDLGEALGQEYVAQTFGPEGKQRTLAMVQALEKALNRDIKELPWMTEETKKQALIKLEAIQNKIGYPDKWRDYSTLKIVRGDAMGNSLRANQFETHRVLVKIGKPVDKSEWGMTPPTVNAYYNPLENNINFPAGILQPPFFDKNGDDAINFGGIGAVIGHELTHGFDDQGRQFDAQGNLRDWWTPADAKAFNERAQCFVDEYSGFTAVDDVKLNGKLTLGENAADNGGVRIALMALLDTLGNNGKELNGFTPEQRLFLGWGQIWCQNQSPEFARMVAAVDPHSPGRYRINGVVSNMPEFQQAFHCKAGAPMVRANACRVW